MGGQSAVQGQKKAVHPGEDDDSDSGCRLANLMDVSSGKHTSYEATRTVLFHSRSPRIMGSSQGGHVGCTDGGRRVL